MFYNFVNFLFSLGVSIAHSVMVSHINAKIVIRFNTFLTVLLLAGRWSNARIKH